MLDEESDEEMRELAKEELNESKARIEELEQELKVLLLPKDPNDDKNVIVETVSYTHLDVYKRQEMRQALEKRQGKELQQHFFSATVAICGLGGLGSNIAISLARAGVGKLILIDFDKVDVTNLHRQQYKASQIGRYKTEALSENLKEIAPYVELETHTTRMTEQNVVELLKEADVICEACLLYTSRCV